MTAANAQPAVITVTRSFAASPETIFDAWLDQATVGEWLFATPMAEFKRAELDPRPGGHFVISEKRGETLAEHFGTYEIVDRPTRLVFTFATAKDQPPTRVSVALAREGGGCTLTLQQTVDGASADLINRSHQGWTKILETLAKRPAA